MGTALDGISTEEIADWIEVDPAWLSALVVSGEIASANGDPNVVDPRRLQDWLCRRRRRPQSDRHPDLPVLGAVDDILSTWALSEATFERALELIARELGAVAAVLVMADEHGSPRRMAATGSAGDNALRRLEALGSWVAARGESLLLPDPRRVGASPRGIDARVPRDLLAVPLRSRGASGALVVLRTYEGPELTERDRGLLGAIAARIGLMFEVMRQARELEAERKRAVLAQHQLEAYARDLKRTFAAERNRAEELDRALSELKQTYLATVQGMAMAVEAKDEYTGGHLVRVTRYGLAMMRRIAPELADDREFEFGFLLHDLGKLAVPDRILKKNGPLTDEEWAVMRSHPEVGYRILAGIPFLERAREIVHAHHERWDGHGYPRRLKGDEIPLGARVFPVADTFDAMTSDRPYRAALPVDAALKELERAAGTQFWADAVDAFVELPSDELVAMMSTGSELRRDGG